MVEAPKSYLNGRITKLHLVRAEPIEDAAVVGYLVATKEVYMRKGEGGYRRRTKGVYLLSSFQKLGYVSSTLTFVYGFFGSGIYVDD